MKTLLVNRNVLVSIFTVILLIYGVEGTSYGQSDAPTATPGETNTSLVVRFQTTLDEGVDENAYQIQVRRKTPQEEWISKCVVIKRGIQHEIAGDPDVFASAIYISGIIFHFGDWSDETFNIRAIFTELEPGTTYEVRYRDTNHTVCVENPPSPDPWSTIAEGTTHLVVPPRAEFVDTNLAIYVRHELGLDTKGGHIDLLKIPQASLAKLTKLELDDEEITDLTGLEHANQLADLDLSYNQISDVTPLAHLTQLVYLDLSDNQISDITPLAQLTQLTELELDRNQISDISPLAQPTQLTKLLLWNNQISDISPLAGLPSLKYLSLSSNQISDVTLLTTFASLESLRHILLSGNPITDISPVRKLKRENPNLSISIDIPVILTDPSGEPDLYVIADAGSILQINLNRINVQKISPQSLRTYDIAIDIIDGKIYWSRRDKIQRANLDGTKVQDIVTGLDEPEDIALDVSGGKIYWTVERGDRIQRANLNGTNVQDVVTGLNRPYGIALDVSGGKIYWTVERGDRIQRANFDGTNVQDIVTGLDEVKDTAIDASGGKIYWTEQSGHRIQRANLDGSDTHEVVIDLDGPRGIALDIAGDRIYWADYSQNMIWRSNLDGSDVQLVAIGVSSATAIAFYPSVHTTEPTVLKEDVNGDGIVNIQDLVLVASNLGKTGQNASDINGDGLVNIQDLVLVAGALGTSAAAPSLHPQALEMLTATEVKQWLSAAQQLDITDTTSQRGILFLQQLLVTLTPKETTLLPNYPNPFNPETWIPYQLAKPTDVRITIYSSDGKLVRTLVLGTQPMGIYQTKSRTAYWDGRNALSEPVASGVYFYTLTAGDFTATRKMLILK